MDVEVDLHELCGDAELEGEACGVRDPRDELGEVFLVDEVFGGVPVGEDFVFGSVVAVGEFGVAEFVGEDGAFLDYAHAGLKDDGADVGHPEAVAGAELAVDQLNAEFVCAFVGVVCAAGGHVASIIFCLRLVGSRSCV